MDETTRDVLGVVLAGGQSTRMGRAKALLRFDGEPLVVRVVRVVRQVTRDVVVVGDPSLSSVIDVPVVGDETPGLGPLAALRTALGAAGGRDVVLVGCDMPFLAPAALRVLLTEADQRPDADIVLPCTDEGRQFLHAFYRARCLPLVTRLLATGTRALARLTDEVNVAELSPTALQAVDPSGLSTMNVNTPAEYARAVELLPRVCPEGGPPRPDMT